MRTASPPGTAPGWRIASCEAAVGVAERDALGTTARLAVWPPGSLAEAAGAVDRELARLDHAASRFRPDSEISAVHALAGQPVTVSEALAEAVGVALAAAAWTAGLVDPTVGAALAALGYDRDFAQLRETRPAVWPPLAVPAPGWRSVRLTGHRLQVPAGVLLDLGATAKGLCADRAARAALAGGRAGGVLVSLGGDIAVAGDPPRRGWPVVAADDDHQQVVRIQRGGLATSSTTCRQWIRCGTVLHHIIDPRTGQPAQGPWRTVSVAAATCADANAAATGAIVCGASAPAWLTGRTVQSRLVGGDGRVLRTCGWPAGDDCELTPPAAGWLRR